VNICLLVTQFTIMLIIFQYCEDAIVYRLLNIIENNHVCHTDQILKLNYINGMPKETVTKF